MRRICCFCETWGSGGIEAFLQNVLLHMEPTDLQIDVVAVRQKDSVFTSALSAAGISVTELSGTLRSRKNAALFRRLLQARQYDVIHFNLFQGLALHYVKIAKDMGVPVRIVHSHGAGLRKSSTRAVKLLLHRMGRAVWLSSATALWACSKAAAAFLFGKKAAAAQLVPNGIDTEAFRFCPEDRDRIRRELGWSGETVVGTVGRLSGEKNQGFLLDVFAAFTRMCPQGRLLLVGDGEEKAALQKKAAALGIAEKTVFRGATDQVAELLCAMDVFVLPSLTEGLGIACIEAQCAGLPVLLSRGVPPEARLTQAVTVLSLEEGARRWADALFGMLPPAPRQDAAAAVRAAGFDIHDTAAMVRRGYLEN